MRLPGLLLLLCACRPPEPGAAAPGTLRAAATVQIDSSGIPHIRAANAEDAWLLQGYFTARDRLFQMDMTRRRAFGRRAEILGEEKRDSDVLSRALQFGTWAERTAERLRTEDPEEYGWFEAYTAGVNAFLAEVEAGDAELSPQFAALGYSPEPWRIEDSLAIDKLITAGLSMRADQDVTLGLLRVLLGSDGFEDLYRIAAFDRTYIVPDFYDARPAAPTPPTPRPVPTSLPAPALRALWERKDVLDLALGGSNAWVVGGEHVEGGGSLLASDSHQGITHPTSYYMAHVRIEADDPAAEPSMDVIGATFAGVPFVVFGANRHLAFAPTTAIFDVADVYLETWADDNQRSVLHNGEAVPIERWTEELRIRSPGGAVEDATVEVLELGHVPHHGPLLPPDALDLPLELPLSITWTGFQAHSSARAFEGLDAARDFNAVQTALSTYRAGGMHWLVAQKDGSIGYTGRVDLPLREQVDPGQPPISLLPGVGGYDWLPGDGDRPYARVPDARVPWTFNPAAGWLTTANNDPVGHTDDEDPWDEEVYLSGIFDIGTRAAAPAVRIAELVAQRQLNLDDMAAIQRDDTSRIALRILPHLLEAAQRHPELLDEPATWAIDQLSGWDLRCGVDDVPPTLFHAWLAITVRETLEDERGGLIGDLLFEEMDYQLGLVAVKFLAHWLDATAADPDAMPFPSATGDNYFDDSRTNDRVETRDELLLGSLNLAMTELAPRMESLGLDPEDPQTWTWGSWHRLRLVDAADAVLPAASSPSYPKGGGLYTVDVGDYTWLEGGQLPETLEVTNAPSNRFLFHLREDGMEARFILPGGQSEQPGAAHHLDLLEAYVAGETRVLPYSEAEIDAATEVTWELPAGWPEVPRGL
jgi:penicillin amidase